MLQQNFRIEFLNKLIKFLKRLKLLFSNSKGEKTGARIIHVIRREEKKYFNQIKI